jgi:hypothetical protein
MGGIVSHGAGQEAVAAVVGDTLAKETSSDAIAQLLDKPVRASTHQDGRDIILDDIELSTV